MFVGTLNTGDVPLLNLTRTGATDRSGWHLLGNPYPSPLNWDLVARNLPAGTSRAISVYQASGPGAGRWLTRVNGTGSLSDGELAFGQSFWLRVSAPGGFTVSNDARTTHYSGPRHYRPAASAAAGPLLTLQFYAPGTPQARRDEATVYFDAVATVTLDDAFDGEPPALNDGLPTIGSLTAAADWLAVNGLPLTALAPGTVVPLRLHLPVARTYILIVKQLLNLSGTDVALYDYATATRYHLATQPSLTFTVAAAGALAGRFALVFGHQVGLAAPNVPADLVLYSNPASGIVRLTLPASATRAELLDATGRVARLLTTDARPPASVRPDLSRDLSLDLDGLAPSVYTVRAGARTRSRGSRAVRHRAPEPGRGDFRLDFVLDFSPPLTAIRRLKPLPRRLPQTMRPA